MALYLRNATLHDQEILIQREDRERNWMGDVRLQRCRLVIDQPVGEFGFGAPCDLTDCFIVAKRPLMNFQGWTAVRLRRCKFVGTFIGNDFGRWTDVELDQLCYGSVEDCDFTDTTLHFCRFLNVGVNNIHIASWPQFVLPYPGRAAKVSVVGAQPGIQRFMEVNAPDPLDQVTAAVDDAVMLQKDLHVTEQELRAALDTINGVPLE
jgi:hypothetical protein